MDDQTFHIINIVLFLIAVSVAALGFEWYRANRDRNRAGEHG